MKFTSILISLFGVCIALLPVLAAPLVVSLEKRTPHVPSLIGHSATFYRAVTGGELAHISNYPKGQHPKTYAFVPGDFAHDGALYVFSDKHEAELWGESFASVALDPKRQMWYLVTFKYTPKTGLKTKSFTSGSDDWKNFVNGNYQKGGTHYDIIEGPVSVGRGSRMQAYVNAGGNNVYQAAFASPATLNTLTVEEVSEHHSKSNVPWCPSCNIM